MVRASDLPLCRRPDVAGPGVFVLEAGLQRLDGGAMFGVVPKPLWERRIPADERNRIPLALRCLLVVLPDELVVVDTGAGNTPDAKFREIFGIENEGSPTRLEDAIRAAGYSPDDVTVVINTHLHFDHAGGNTRRKEDGALVDAFPRARYVIQRDEWAFAHRDNERIRASYVLDNFDPLATTRRLDLVPADTEVLPGVRFVSTPGHTPHHQSVLIDTEPKLFFAADLAPTSAHLPLTWTMGYDLEPLVSLESKREWLGRARDEGWLVVFPHDPVVPWGRLDPAERRFALLPHEFVPAGGSGGAGDAR